MGHLAAFFNARLLVRCPQLLSVYGPFILVNLVSYGVSYGLPVWFEQSRGFPVFAAGPLQTAGCRSGDNWLLWKFCGEQTFGVAGVEADDLLGLKDFHIVGGEQIWTS